MNTIDTLNRLRDNLRQVQNSYNHAIWERDVAIAQLNELGYEFGEHINTLSEKQRISELQDVCACWQSRYEGLYDDIEQILIEGEDTDIGRQVTIKRLKEYFFKYDE